MLPALLVAFISLQPACTDVQSCRAAALEAYERKDYEVFHDLAWLAYRKGRPDDAELMLMLARAQSLSGRPGDAVVMLERLAARGVTTDAETSEDFAAVRALPRWKRSTPSSEAPKAPSSEVTKAPSTEVTKAPSTEVTKAPSSEETKAPSAKSPGTLAFTTLLAPTALAYDAVSKRYVIADRQARRIAIVDENTGHVSTLAGAQAALGDVNGIAIDAQQGDLWVASSDGDAATLHRLQLISGRVLSGTPITGLSVRIVALTFARGAGLIAADARGDLWRVRPNGRAEKLGALEYVPRTLAADSGGTLYIGAGGPRLAKFSVTPSLRRLGVVEVDSTLPGDAPFAVVGSHLHFVVPANGAYEIRTIR